MSSEDVDKAALVTVRLIARIVIEEFSVNIFS